MTLKSILLFLGKLVLGGLAFSSGLMLGGMIATMSGLPTPTLPPEMNADRALLTMVATSPLLVLALYFVGRDLAGPHRRVGAVGVDCLYAQQRHRSGLL